MFRAFLSFLGRPRFRAARRTRQVYRAGTLPVSFRPLLETLEDRVVPTAVYHVTDGASLAAAVQTADSQHVAAEIILGRCLPHHFQRTCLQ